MKRKKVLAFLCFFQLIQHIKFDGWSEELVQNCWPTGQRHHLHLYRQWNQRWVLPGVHEQCPVIWRGMRDMLSTKPSRKYNWKCNDKGKDNIIYVTAQVSNLFARDESDEILNDLVPIMKREFPKRPPTNENLYEYFMSRVQKNLHVVLCFSPVGEKFRNRALKFPALISGCTMDWFSRWPKDALVAGIVAIIKSSSTNRTVLLMMDVLIYTSLWDFFLTFS